MTRRESNSGFEQLLLFFLRASDARHELDQVPLPEVTCVCAVQVFTYT